MIARGEGTGRDRSPPADRRARTRPFITAVEAQPLGHGRALPRRCPRDRLRRRLRAASDATIDPRSPCERRRDPPRDRRGDRPRTARPGTERDRTWPIRRPDCGTVIDIVRVW